MTRFHEQDLTGAQFERVSLRDARMKGVDLTGARMRGVELVEAELNRLMPERAKMRPGDSDGFREAWAILERLWKGTVARAMALPEAALHRNVDDEWSFIQTLRHLNFASAAWVDRMLRGTASPWHALDLPWDDAPGWDGIPWDRDARPSLDEVLTVRRERQAMVRHVLESLTDTQLTADVTRIEPGWPRMENFPVTECLRIVLNEEWQHRLYAERDLDALSSADRVWD
jgi:hypothetical protein